MKIVHVIFSLSSGGAERVVLNLCNEQSKTHEVILLTVLEENPINSFYKSQLNPEVNHICLNSGRGIKLRNFIRVYKILKGLEPDAVHYHLNTIVYGFVPALFLKLRSVHTLHSVAQLALGFKGQKSINRWFYKRNKIVPVALSQECYNSIATVYGINDAEIVLNGVPGLAATSESLEAATVISELRKTADHIVYVHVARYNLDVKNQNLLFSVFKEIVQEDKAISLIVIGRDFPQMEIPNVHFLGEIKNPMEYISNSDAMILSSLYEGIPMSVLEAFSCGIPVVSTPAGGVNDLLKNEKLGLLSKDFSETSFKESVESMTKKIREEGFRKEDIIEEFRENYSIETCSNAYLKIYSSKS